ncbi:MAG: AAA family ATPase [Sphingobium sp.]|nr:AAA family ATPase [Sphingobium sp.]
MAKEPALATIAVYSLKGGVGKTTFAINLAWASASISKRRTLLWDLDPQAASSWLVSTDSKSRDAAHSIFSKDVEVKKLIQPSTVPGLDLIAADTSLRSLDHLFREMDKKKRLSKLIESLGKDYDRIILDCPPGLTETSEQVLRAADLIVIPVIPQVVDLMPDANSSTPGIRLNGSYTLLGRDHELVFRGQLCQAGYGLFGYARSNVATPGNFPAWDGSYAEPTWGARSHRRWTWPQAMGLFCIDAGSI